MKNIKIFSNILAGCQFKYSRYNANSSCCLLQVDGKFDFFIFEVLQIFSGIAEKG